MGDVDGILSICRLFYSRTVSASPFRFNSVQGNRVKEDDGLISWLVGWPRPKRYGGELAIASMHRFQFLLSVESTLGKARKDKKEKKNEKEMRHEVKRGGGGVEGRQQVLQRD